MVFLFINYTIFLKTNGTFLDALFFLTNIIARIIEAGLKTKTGSIGILRRYEKDMPKQNDIAQYSIGLFNLCKPYL